MCRNVCKIAAILSRPKCFNSTFSCSGVHRSKPDRFTCTAQGSVASWTVWRYNRHCHKFMCVTNCVAGPVKWMAHLQHLSHFQQNRTATTDTSIQTPSIFIFRLYFGATIKQFDKGIVAVVDKSYRWASLCTRICPISVGHLKQDWLHWCRITTHAQRKYDKYTMYPLSSRFLPEFWLLSATAVLKQHKALLPAA